MNRTLSGCKQPFQKVVLSFHPERSQAKVKFLIDQAECPVSNPPPMTMIINIPERVLLVKVTKMSDERALPVARTSVPRLLERLGIAEAAAER